MSGENMGHVTTEQAEQLSREQVFLLKFGEMVLHRGFVTSAVEALIRGVRPAGKSAFQRMVRLEDLDELVRRTEEMKLVNWPIFIEKPRHEGKVREVHTGPFKFAEELSS
jgi:hypothetical protein